MSYIGTEPKDIRSFGRTKFDYTATQGQTAFTGADDDGKVLAFTVGQIEVYVNGILMDDSDFTTTGTGTVTLASAANLNDVVNVVSFETNIPDNDYVPASGGTFSGNVTHSGNVTFSGTTSGIDMNGTELVLDADGDTSITADTDDHIDFKTAGTDRLKITTDKVQFNVDAKVDSDNARDLGSGGARWKDLYLSGGAYIGGTGSANKLSDYETGNWTPATSEGVGVTSYNSTYIKVGRKVYLQFYLTIASNSNANVLTISGLPFTPTDSYSVGFLNNAIGADAFCFQVDATSAVMRLKNQTNTHKSCSTMSGQYMIGTVTYSTAS